MKNIDTAFRYIRFFSVVFLVGCVSICCYMIYSTNITLEKTKGKVYVMVSGQLVEAVARDRNMPVELRNHTQLFHHYFFTLSPDEKAIQHNMNRAFYLADGSAKRQYENLREAGYYSSLIAGNISQSITVDSIRVDMRTSPYHFTCHGKQVITRATSVVTRSLITEGFLRTGINQSDNNVHGFLIERWAILENKDIKTTSR